MVPFSARRTYNNNNSISAIIDSMNMITEDNSQKQELFTKTRARVVAQMDAFFNKYKNNNASLNDMIDNMTRFENMLDTSTTSWITFYRFLAYLLIPRSFNLVRI